MVVGNTATIANPLSNKEITLMGRSGIITFKGNPMTLSGDGLSVKDSAPEFTLHFVGEGIQTLTKADLAGKATLLNVVPSLDTPVCAVQTKRFNEELAGLGDDANAVTVSRDLPFAQARFCGAEDIKMQTASDYKTREFGTDFGLNIEELELLTRAVLVLDKEGNVAYQQVVSEVTEEPDYEAALAALRMVM